ncbi:transcription initiation factor TFIID subunit 6-like isoform X2 [Sycon ciliatum]|uniref:transcription initiation factor TFIID subunit 6-like isoform X2 n=1 Tax=Sycon ciliatum TaxID=27933 RepID=UPI0031F6D4D6
MIGRWCDMNHMILSAESKKFMNQSRRTRLCRDDLDYALAAQNVDPLYGFSSTEHLPFRQASGGGRELHFHEETEIDVQDIIGHPLPKVPADISIRAHWLAIDGRQPSVPENPPPVSATEQKSESWSTLSGKQPLDKSATKPPPVPGITSQKRKASMMHLKSLDGNVKPLSMHSISAEQQLFFKEITESCVGPSDAKRTEALNSLSTDPGLYQLLPRFSLFICEGVKLNVVHKNLPVLRHLVRMAKALMDNSSLYLEKYLHELLPVIITCVVSRQLCLRPEVEDHWSLRHEAGKLLAAMCKNFTTTTNELQKRVTKMLVQAFYDVKAALSTHFGALATFFEMGPEVVRTVVLPQLVVEGRLLLNAINSGSQVQKVAAESVQSFLLRHLPQVLKRVRSPPDVPDDYSKDYGYLGSHLCNSVTALRKTGTVHVTKTAPTSTASAPTSLRVSAPASTSSTPSNPGTPVPRTPAMIKTMTSPISLTPSTASSPVATPIQTTQSQLLPLQPTQSQAQQQQQQAQSPVTPTTQQQRIAQLTAQQQLQVKLAQQQQQQQQLLQQKQLQVQQQQQQQQPSSPKVPQLPQQQQLSPRITLEGQPRQPSPQMAQQQLSPQVLSQQQLSPQVVRQQLSPQLVQQQLSPQLVQQQLSPQVAQKSPSPQAVQPQLSPQVVQQQLSPQVAQKRPPSPQVVQQLPSPRVVQQQQLQQQQQQSQQAQLSPQIQQLQQLSPQSPAQAKTPSPKPT